MLINIEVHMQNIGLNKNRHMVVIEDRMKS